MNILNKQSKDPYYLQLSNALEEMIRSGYFSHGEKLPTLTEMREIFNISLKVAAQTYEDLSHKELIYSRRGKGFFVAYHESIKIDLDYFYQIEANLVHEMNMERHILLMEKIVVDDYVAEQLNLDSGDYCYHIKQTYGKELKNVLFEDIYLPLHKFKNLSRRYNQYLTLPSLIMNGYRYALDSFSNKYFSSSVTVEMQFILKLKLNEPLWRVESIYFTDEKEPIALVNHYLSGEYVTMEVSLNVD
ncbi:GntR family transcriptional regulator [Mycoplasmatota bacterium]|nr:GntR family transcriptional regulator [Mycoplasmatota bacterium]